MLHVAHVSTVLTERVQLSGRISVRAQPTDTASGGVTDDVGDAASGLYLFLLYFHSSSCVFTFCCILILIKWVSIPSSADDVGRKEKQVKSRRNLVVEISDIEDKLEGATYVSKKLWEAKQEVARWIVLPPEKMRGEDDAGDDDDEDIDEAEEEEEENSHIVLLRQRRMAAHNALRIYALERGKIEKYMFYV